MLKLHDIPMVNNSLCFSSNPPCLNPIKPLFTITCCRYSASASHGSGSNFYKLLSLTSKNAGTEEIKRAYRTLALKYHPDVCDDKDATKTFVLLHTAYTTLVDPVLREEYDNTLVECPDQPGHICVNCAFTDQVGEKRWEVQIMELKKRSSNNTYNYSKEGSWGSRMSLFECMSTELARFEWVTSKKDLQRPKFYSQVVI